MSIRDRPASLTFTVTLESLREEDAGTYGCGIDVPFSVDPTFQVEVSVVPGEPEMPALGLLTVPGTLTFRKDLERRVLGSVIRTQALSGRQAHSTCPPLVLRDLLCVHP